MSGKNVLVLTSTFPRWEGDRFPPFVYELSRRLRAQGSRVVVIAPFSRGSQEFEEIDGIRIYRFKYWFGKGEHLADVPKLPGLGHNKTLAIQIPFFVLGQFLALMKAVRKERIDTIHAHWILPQGLIAVLYRLLSNRRLRVVMTAHGADVFGLRRFDFLKRFALNRSDRISAVSSALAGEIRRIGCRNAVSVIPMGVDLDLFSPEKRSTSLREHHAISGPMLLFVGRLTEKKGIEYLIDAMPAVIKALPETKLLVIGEGEEEQRLRSRIAALGIESSVIMTGPIHNSQLPEYYATADIFIGPSVIARSGDREGLPVTYLEALASGCLVVATDLEGNRDIIEDGVTGIMVRQRNATALSEKIIMALEQPDPGGLVSMQAIKDVLARHDWDAVTKSYADLLSDNTSPT